MSQYTCHFSRLPGDLHETFLLQAYQQLDQRTRYSVLPLVCRLWRRLANSSCSALAVRLHSHAGVTQLAAYIQKHGRGLQELNLRFSLLPSSCLLTPWEGEHLADAVGTASQLCSLDVASWPWHTPFNPSELSALTHLTRLRLTSCRLINSQWTALSCLVKLQHLSLAANPNITARVGITALQQLTSLNLAGNGLDPDALTLLRQLPQLQALELACCRVYSQQRSLEQLGQLPCRSLSLQLLDGQQHLQQVAACLSSPRLKQAVEELCISYEGLGQLGLPQVSALAAALAGAPRLRRLGLHSRRFDICSNAEALSQLVQLTALFLELGALSFSQQQQQQQGSSSMGLAALSVLTGLCKLHVRMVDDGMEAALKQQLGQQWLPHLVELTVGPNLGLVFSEACLGVDG